MCKRAADMYAIAAINAADMYAADIHTFIQDTYLSVRSRYV